MVGVTLPTPTRSYTSTPSDDRTSRPRGGVGVNHERCALNVAIVFPGQGTQTPAMGAPWRDHPAWSVVTDAEAASGEPLADLILHASADQLARTREAQLAVLVTSLVAWSAIRDRIPEPIAFAGHSLGQVTALVAAGALDPAAGVHFAARRATFTQTAADEHPGRMAALVGATIDQAERACDAANGECWIANDNAPGQVVIAGTPNGLDAAMAAATELGVRRSMPLKVGGAVHTPLMHDAALALAADLAQLEIADTSAPVVSNADATAYTDGDGWRDRLAHHVEVPVRWREVQTTLTGLGATHFIEVGHGSMLAAMAKRTVADVTVHRVATPDDLDATMAALSEVVS